MLEFLGLQEEVGKIFIGALIIALSLGFPLGSAVGAKKEKKSTNVFIIIGSVISVITLFICAWPLLMLFITFQWKWIIFALLLMAGVGALCFFISYGAAAAKRKRKYRKNPIMKEAVKYCRENNVVGIQCTRYAIRFFDRLPNSDYCKDETVSRFAAYEKQCTEYENTDFRPDSWKAYDKADHAIVFADRAYAELEDLDIFAKVLSSSLKGFGVACHKAYVEYKGYRVSNVTGVGERAHHFIYRQDDRFVYSKKACKMLKKQEEKTDGLTASFKKETPKKNTWE